MTLPESMTADEFGQLLAEARAGSTKALGRLLMDCRSYLLMVANRGLGADLQGKLSPSDLVQESFLEAQRDFAGFRGERPEELLAWLARILSNNVANASRSFRGTAMRQPDREVPLIGAHGELPQGAPYDSATPSKNAMAREQVEALEKALTRLPDHYRQVIQLRYRDQKSFAAISEIMGSTVGAVQKLWLRAIAQLEKEMNSGHGP